MLVAIGLLVVAGLLPSSEQAQLNVRFEAAAWVMIGFALIWVVARAVFAPGQVTYHRIVGAVLLYLTIGLVFVGLFTLTGLVSPGSFSGLRIDNAPGLASELIDFSFVTLTSIGYGDIFPAHPLARSLCNVEGIIGQLYPATLLARLVTLGRKGGLCLLAGEEPTLEVERGRGNDLRTHHGCQEIARCRRRRKSQTRGQALPGLVLAFQFHADGSSEELAVDQPIADHSGRLAVAPF